jgi:hypothetical protein
MGLLQRKKDIIEIKVFKQIDDLKSIDDVLYEPRSWSPDELKDACNNLSFESDKNIGEFENLTIQYIIRNFFFIMHQTGLYNPQKKLWTQLAQTKKITIRPYKKIPRKERENTKINDIIFEDNNKKFILVRLVYPGSQLNFAGFRPLISSISSRCVGIFYITDQSPDSKNLKLIQDRTNSSDFFDKYRSPITPGCSFNLVKYQVETGKLIYRLVHPNLNKNVEAELCFNYSEHSS